MTKAIGIGGLGFKYDTKLKMARLMAEFKDARKANENRRTRIESGKWPAKID